MIKNGLTILFLLISMMLEAQQDTVLMRINGKDILRSEFEYIYNKNNALAGVEQKTLNEYLDLFVNFKLKVDAAEVAGADTTRAFREELDGYRRQLAKNYMNDEADVERSAREIYDKMKLSRHAGQVHVSHIFKYLPQNITGSALRVVQSRMDSIYEALKKSGTSDFDTYVNRFSDEKKSFRVSWLQMPTEFEDIVFNLQPGEISRPFFTPQGVHIVKVLERKEVLPFEEIRDEIISRQTHKDGMHKGIVGLVDQLKKEYRYSSDKAGVDELLSKGSTDKVLFVLDEKIYTGKEFARFATTYTGGIRRQLDGYILKSVLDYEDSRLEQKYPEFRLLMQEYREGMMLFDISNREVWERASSDEVGLAAYYKERRADYNWEKSRYKGVILHCTTKKVAKQVRKLLKDISETEWLDAIRLTFNAGDQPKVQAEQGLYAPGDNTYVDEHIFKKGKSQPVMSFPFTALVGMKLKGPEGYQEVRGALVADYQNYLEKRWVAQLRAVGKVEINQEVLKTVNNH